MPFTFACSITIVLGLWYISFSDLISWLSIFSQDDYLVSKPVKEHLAKYDKQLKKFNVSKALDAALEVVTDLFCPEYW